MPHEQDQLLKSEKTRVKTILVVDDDDELLNTIERLMV